MSDKLIVVITGAAGNLGTALKSVLQQRYTVVGLDRPGSSCDIEMDITSDPSVELGFRKFRENYGNAIAAVIHLAAYFDFSGEDSPLYHSVNVQGTQRLLSALQAFAVERFIYASTMLVHRPAKPGEWIDESTPIAPQWQYPLSKAEAEAVIAQHHGAIPYTILRLAGLYDEQTAVPTLAHQIARVYERDIKSILYAGDIHAGQAFLHRDDMIALFEKVIKRRNQLPEEIAILAGEAEVLSYRELQHQIGQLLHGEKDWQTLSLPTSLAKAGAWLEEKAEPLIPDGFDEGKTPFIKPFMIDMASDHYALDIRRARELLDWRPEHHLQTELPQMLVNLQRDPLRWYEKNQLPPPAWMKSAGEKNENPEQLRRTYEQTYRQQHQQNLWAHFLNIGLGFWLITAPATLGYSSSAMQISDIVSGVLVIGLGLAALSTHSRLRLTRWFVGAVGVWLMAAPLVFWTSSAAAYLNGVLVGALVTGFALLVRPEPGISPAAAQTGPIIPPGWDFSPSDWLQRLPIIALAFVGFFISRYLAAYQLGHIDGVWEPFFSGPASTVKNGTEEIITSSISEAWPVPDAGLGALVYQLEILTGLMGSRARWRTMPWLVLLFGFMIIPLGVVSLTFIIIQPIILDTWCTLCLVAAAAMLLQIPYSFDEIIATLEFLKRRAAAGRPWLLVLFTGDTDEGSAAVTASDEFTRPAAVAIREMLNDGISISWPLLGCIIIGVWLMFTRMTLGSEGPQADAEHLIGALVLTITITAFAEVMRPLRFLMIFLGLALMITPFVFAASMAALLSSLICGLALIVLSLPRSAVKSRYGVWSKVIV